MGEGLAYTATTCMGATMSQSSGTRSGLFDASMAEAVEEADNTALRSLVVQIGQEVSEARAGNEPYVDVSSGPVQLEQPSLAEHMRPLIERTISGLNKKRFLPDPIAGSHFSRIVSVMSSSYKRHGYILEAALLEQLKRCSRLIAWNDPTFQVPSNADLLANGSLSDPSSIVGNNVNYGSGSRTLQVDAIIYDKDKKSLRAYEVKRGFGYHDAGKRRSILRDTLCLSVLLKSYGESRGLEVKETSAHVIFYYGVKSIPAPFALSGTELDDHFGWPVHAELESVNDLFRQRLFGILAAA
jgi:hypothetical protein